MVAVEQPELWAYAQRKPMGRQLAAVYDVMSDGAWYTFADLVKRLSYRGIGISEAGVSARIRDLRLNKYGAHTVDRRKRGALWQYRMAS